MKKSILIILSCLSAISAMAQLNPQSKKITERYFKDADSIENVTPALQKRRGFTDEKELTVFLNKLKAEHPAYISIKHIGKSQKGRDISMVLLTSPNDQTNKIKVWMQGGLHGNEPASTEGLLYLLHNLLNSAENKYLLDKIELAVVPMANIDGYVKQSRYAANGLDLNRDQTKLMAPESVVLKQAFSDFNPQIGVDFHEYNAFRRDFSKMGDFGVAALYDIMFLYSGNLNVPVNMRAITDTLFVENARKCLDKNNLRHHPYISTVDYHGDIHFNQGSSNSRSSATSYALTNTVSTLIEVRGVNLGRTSFKRRISTTYLIGLSYLKTAYANAQFVKEEIAKAQRIDSDITVTSSRKIYNDTITVIDLDTYDLLDMEITVRDALQSKSKLTRKRPEAYLINAANKDLIEKLTILGVKVETLTEEAEYNVEAYIVSAYDKSNMRYENMNLQDVETALVNKIKLFPKGTFIIYTNQKNAPMITEVLEPEAPNSFISFGVLKTELNQELPIYRLSKKN